MLKRLIRAKPARMATADADKTCRIRGIVHGYVHANTRPAWQPVPDMAGCAHSRRAAARAARRLPPVGVARGADRLDRHLRARTLGVEDAARRRHPRLPVRL